MYTRILQPLAGLLLCAPPFSNIRKVHFLSWKYIHSFSQCLMLPVQCLPSRHLASPLPHQQSTSYLQLLYEVIKNKHATCNHCIVHTQTLTLHSSQNLLGHRSEPESCAARSGTDRSCSTLSCTASGSWGMLQQTAVTEASLSICLLRTKVQNASTPQWPRVKCQTQHHSSMFLTTLVDIRPLTIACSKGVNSHWPLKCRLFECVI